VPARRRACCRRSRRLTCAWSTPLDALKLAPLSEKAIVFFGSDSNHDAIDALTILQAEREASAIFRCLQSHHHHPHIKAILDSPSFKSDGFLGRGM